MTGGVPSLPPAEVALALEPPPPVVAAGAIGAVLQGVPAALVLVR